MKEIETYRDVVITYNEGKDRFEAQVDDERLRYNEKLSALKESIDKALDEEPKPAKQEKIEAYYLVFRDWVNEADVKNVTITSFGLRRRWRGDKYVPYARVRGARSYKEWEFMNDFNNLAVKNEENWKKIQAYQAIQKEKEAMIEQYDKKLAKARKEIKLVKVPKEDKLPIWN